VALSLSVIVGCMGRRIEAEQFVPAVLVQLAAADELVLVDFGDPDGVTEWAVALAESRLTVVRFWPARWFHPNLARNLGCRVAVNEVLVVSDIDKLMPDALLDECRALAVGEFVVQPNGTGSIGWLAVRAADFFNVSGYEEALCGYGWDDFVMRETLNKSGLKMRFSGNLVTSVAREVGCRIYPDARRHVSSHVNMRVARDLRILHPFRGNIARNWGAGGVVIVESEARKNACSRGRVPRDAWGRC